MQFLKVDVNSGRMAALVDREMAALGDPLTDLVTMCAYQHPSFDHVVGERAASTSPLWPGVDATAQRYATLTGTDLEWFDRYRALALFRLAVIAEGITARYRSGIGSGPGFETAQHAVPGLLATALSIHGGRAATDRQVNPFVTGTESSAPITGGSRGIGFGITELLAARGWALTLRACASTSRAKTSRKPCCCKPPMNTSVEVNGTRALTARHGDQLEEADQKLATAGGRVQTVAGDIADDTTISTAVAQHHAAFGSLSALVLAAGVGTAVEIAGYPMSRYDKQFAVNVRAPFALVSLALPLLRRSATVSPTGRTHVVAITSIEGVHPEQGLAAYGVSKAALISLVRSVNAEENVRGVLATATSPAFVATELSAWTVDTIPADSMIAVADIVNVVDLLLNPDLLA